MPSSADRKSTRLNSSHGSMSYAVFCLKKKKTCDVGDFCALALAVPLHQHGRDDPVSEEVLPRRPQHPLLRSTPLARRSLFFFNDPAPPEIYALSLHAALPISPPGCWPAGSPGSACSSVARPLP